MTALQILVYLLTLSVLVVLHEYGHFLVARRNGVRVTDFALGFGPTIAKWTSPRSGTVYRWNVLPLGGYCQMKGEDGKSTEAEQQRDFRAAGAVYDADNFQAKTPLQRLAIVVAGPAANFVVALALFVGGALAFGVPNDKPTTTIFQLVPGYPAARAGLQAGDRIVSVDGVVMQDGNQLVDLIHASAGKPLTLVYDRRGTSHQVVVTPRPDVVKGKHVGLVGFNPLPMTHRVGLADAWRSAWGQFSGIITATLGALGGLVTHPSSVAGQFQGPIGMARVSAQAQEFGPYIFLSLAGMISISLGIINLLPVPALDGGRAVFILVEMLRGKPVDPEKEALVHVGGFAVLIALMVAVSFHDVSSALAGGSAF
ncbi:MAG TPA: M50 family metallopeptidase [Candidatus Elarobacter sp.]|jgi:regulator of sigma E protease|nr:M50 family metallopeptidase [Candidatus Elarobacter sp.]